MLRLKTKKQTWESRLQSTTTGMRGWPLSEHNSKVRLRLQFPKDGGWPANAQTNLPYNWEPSAETFTAVQGLVKRIYGDVMEGGVTLKAAIDDVLAISDHKAQEVVTPWPGIIADFKNHKLSQGNRIKKSTFQASYERYLAIALLHLHGRKAAQTGKELAQLVLTHPRTNQKPGMKQGKVLRAVNHAWEKEQLEMYSRTLRQELQVEFSQVKDAEKAARDTLDQLADKGLLDKRKTTLEGKGDVVLFRSYGADLSKSEMSVLWKYPPDPLKCVQP